jgi:hypothetical protein
MDSIITNEQRQRSRTLMFNTVSLLTNRDPKQLEAMVFKLEQEAYTQFGNSKVLLHGARCVRLRPAPGPCSDALFTPLHSTTCQYIRAVFTCSWRMRSTSAASWRRRGSSSRSKVSAAVLPSARRWWWPSNLNE